MTVRLKWGHVAQLAEPCAQGISLTRIFDGLGIAVDQPAVTLPDPCHLALMFEADPADGPVHDLRLQLADAQGNTHSDPMEQPILFEEIGASHLLAPAMVQVNGWVLPGVNEYRFLASINGRKVGAVPISVWAIERMQTPIKPAAKPWLNLRWGHVIEGLAGDADGTISLEGIIDYVPLPPHIDGIIVPQLRLALSFMADPGAGPDHDLKVVLTNPSKQPIAGYKPPLRFTQPMPGLPLCTVATIDFEEVQLLGTGDYVFHVLVDDSPVGQIPFWVVQETVSAEIDG